MNDADIKQQKPEYEKLYKQMLETAARAKIMEQALKFYADKDNYGDDWDDQFKCFVSRMDEGRRAREALKELP